MTQDTAPALPPTQWDAFDRAAFEKDAAALGFNLARSELSALCPEPWSEYVALDTGHRWGGWIAGRESALQSIAADRAARGEVLNEGTIAIARSLAKKLRADMESGVRLEVRAQMFVTARFLETLATTSAVADRAAREQGEGAVAQTRASAPGYFDERPTTIAPPAVSVPAGMSLAQVDQAFEDEIKRVSSVHYDSNAICRHFFGEFRKRLLALAAAPSPTK